MADEAITLAKGSMTHAQQCSDLLAVALEQARNLQADDRIMLRALSCDARKLAAQIHLFILRRDTVSRLGAER